MKIFKLALVESLYLDWDQGGRRSVISFKLQDSSRLPIGPIVVPFWDYLVEF